MAFYSLLGALAGGLAPALLWLWFWLREDSAHPEPRKFIALAFLAGMILVAPVIALEEYVAPFMSQHAALYVAWPLIEELGKLTAAALSVLWLSANDEPIDSVIYMICVALGFAAAENTLFLLSPLAGATLGQTILTGDYRFIGATLLHVLASATVGASLAFAFKRGIRIRIFFVTIGVILAWCLHGLFNFFIMNEPQGEVIRVFAFVWIGLIVLLALFEFIKRISVRAA